MSFDILCFYAEFARPNVPPYLPLIARMTASAKAAMPDARRVLLTPTPSRELSAHFDVTFPYPETVTLDNLCLERCRAHVSWMVTTARPVLFVDPDLEFRSRPVFGDFDVGLMWRDKARPDQPVNMGALLAYPGHNAFWLHYGNVVANLPKSLHYWWCDQMGFSLMTGVCHQAGETLTLDGARVALLPAPDNCDAPESVTEKAWAVHYKGVRKGEGWDKMFPGRAKSTVR